MSVEVLHLEETKTKAGTRFIEYVRLGTHTMRVTACVVEKSTTTTWVMGGPFASVARWSGERWEHLHRMPDPKVDTFAKTRAELLRIAALILGVSL